MHKLVLKPKFLRRLIVRTWLSIGLSVMIYGILLSGCKAVPPIQQAMPTTIDSIQSAEMAFSAEKVSLYSQIWQDETGKSGDYFSAGIAAWKLAAESKDPTWSNAAITKFKAALEGVDSANGKAWLGSSHALMARDFPIQGWWQVIPGPGFVRLLHVWKSFAYLDKAVEMAPKDPVIRLIRGSTYIGMPTIFGGQKDGLADFALMEQWIENSQLNVEFADIITSQSWLQEYFLSCARSMASLGNKEKETLCWQQLYSITKNPKVKEVAKWHLI